MPRLAVGHDDGPGKLGRAGLGGDDRRVRLEDGLERLRVQVVEMLVGDEDEVGLGQGAVVGDLAVGVDVDRLAAEGHHQGAVAEEGDLEIAFRGRDDVLFELRLSRGGPGQAQDDHDQSHDESYPCGIPPRRSVVIIGRRRQRRKAEREPRHRPSRAWRAKTAAVAAAAKPTARSQGNTQDRPVAAHDTAEAPGGQRQGNRQKERRQRACSWVLTFQRPFQRKIVKI